MLIISNKVLNYSIATFMKYKHTKVKNISIHYPYFKHAKLILKGQVLILRSGIYILEHSKNGMLIISNKVLNHSIATFVKYKYTKIKRNIS